MRHNLLIVPVILLAQAACTNQPFEDSSPRPVDFLLRVTTPPHAPRVGTLIFAEPDSLVMFDRNASERVTVRPDSTVILELYQGQRRTADAIAKGTARGVAIGVAAGVGEALLTGLLAKLVGWDVELSETVKGGIVVGGATGALTGGVKGAKEGEAVWERVTLLKIRQQICKCPNPDPPRAEPALRLIP
jgi:hypothetical protein